MILGRGFADFMSSLGRELDVVGLLGMTEDDAVKAAVIFELSEHGEAQAFRVHFGDRSQVIGWSCYSHRRTGLHGNGTQAKNFVGKSKAASRFPKALTSLMNWKKRFESR